MENTNSQPQRPLSIRKISWQKRLFYYLIRTPINLFFMIFYGVRFYGRNNMPEEGGVVVISNHQSHFDPPLIAAGLRRRLNFLARKSLFRFKPFAQLIDLLDAIPLDKEGIGFEGIKESLKRLRGGEMVLVFPEGERTWDGEIAPFLQGSLVLAQRSKTTILPIALNGCYDAWSRTKKFPCLWGKIRVIYGKPIPYTEFKDLNEEELRQLLETKITELFQILKNKNS
jgi:1-acyl-sn-glycerol-3-phosphate acyltransferase